MDQGPKKLGNNQIIHYRKPTLPALLRVNKWIDVFWQRNSGGVIFSMKLSVWHSAKLTELRPRQKTPFGRMGRFNFAFIVCVSSVNGGMAPGEMETIFATEYGIRMCSPFSAGIARRTAIQPKISFPNPTAKTSHLGSRWVRRTEFFWRSEFAYDIAVPAPVWMFEPLGSKSSA